MLPCPDAQGRELLLQDPLVLLHTILHHLRAMPHRTEVPVDPLHEGFAAVPQLTTHREDGHRRPVVRRLEPRARVRVPEDLGRELAHLPTRSHRDGVELKESVPGERHRGAGREALGQLAEAVGEACHVALGSLA